MIKRTIEISSQPFTVCVDHGQLALVPHDSSGHHRVPHAVLGDRRRIPCEDIGLLIVDQRDTMYTHAALSTLLAHGGAVVICGPDHLPAGVLLPFATHTEVLWRMNAQLAMRRPVGKRLWKQIVQAKIRAQAANLPEGSGARRRLVRLAAEVRSGDAGHHESQAARVYWAALFEGIILPGGPFRRQPGGVSRRYAANEAARSPNSLLDYGYAIMRAAVARALVGSGLFPAIGIRHAHRSNAFALADDLVEPLRPIVDARVRELAKNGRLHLDPSVKAELLILLTTTVRTAGFEGPLQVALSRYTASFVRCLEGTDALLDIPVCTGSLPQSRDGRSQQEPGSASRTSAGRRPKPAAEARQRPAPGVRSDSPRRNPDAPPADLGDPQGRSQCT